MIRVGTGLGRYFPRRIPIQLILIHQHTHQLCHSYRRMGVVELEYCLFIEFADIVMGAHIPLHCCLHAC